MAMEKEGQTEFAQGYPKTVVFPDGSTRQVHNAEEERQAAEEGSEYKK